MRLGPVPGVASLSAEESFRPFAFLTVGIAFLLLGKMLLRGCDGFMTCEVVTRGGVFSAAGGE